VVAINQICPRDFRLQRYNFFATQQPLAENLFFIFHADMAETAETIHPTTKSSKEFMLFP
jgi:hypothetical protein